MNWIIGIGILVLIGYLLDREIYFYEGAYLGPRLQACRKEFSLTKLRILLN